MGKTGVLIGLLRAVNVGGTGKLQMADLRAICTDIGLVAPRTYIASGNVVFGTELAPGEAKAKLERALADHAGKPIGVIIRTPDEMEWVLRANPFPDRAPNRVVAIFLDHPPAADTLETVSNRDGEEIALGTREIYVHYGEGMGRSRLRIPAANGGTARNINTVAKLVDMTRERQI